MYKDDTKDDLSLKLELKIGNELPKGAVFSDLLNQQLEAELSENIAEEVINKSNCVESLDSSPNPNIEADIGQSISAIQSEISAIKSKKGVGVDKESKSPNIPRFIEVLLQNNVVTLDMVVRALEIRQKDEKKRRLVDILIEDLSADRDEIFRYLAKHYSFESVDATKVFGDKERLQFIKKLLNNLHSYFYEIAIQRKVLPFELSTNGINKLILVTPDPTHPDIHKVASAFRYEKYEVKYISLADYNELWRQLAFDQGLKPPGLDDIEDFIQVSRLDYEAELEKSIEESIGQGKLADLVESILVDGVRTGASDIHFVPKGVLRTEIYFRIDGKLTLWSSITDIRSEGVLAVVKDRAKNVDRFEKFLSQDGFAQRTIDNQVIRFRFSTMPIYGGDLRSKLESIVIRILRGSEVITGFDSLGMDKHTASLFHKAIRKPQGIVILTGPTGSGKSTTQLAAIKTIMDPSINIITIEDPVEYLIEGCRQVKLNHKLDFESALRGILRHDPDVVMVGEMRDKTSADIAVKLANTGHLVFSTLHTNDSVSAITRLYNMGIEPFLLAYTINIVIAQRLVRRLCDKCKAVDDDIDYDLYIDLGFKEEELLNSTFYKPVGCPRCIKGYKGRIGIYEAFTMSKDMRKLILKSKDFIDEDAIRTLAIKNGLVTLRQSAINLAQSGITSLQEISGIAIDDF